MLLVIVLSISAYIFNFTVYLDLIFYCSKWPTLPPHWFLYPPLFMPYVLHVHTLKTPSMLYLFSIIIHILKNLREEWLITFTQIFTIIAFLSFLTSQVFLWYYFLSFNISFRAGLLEVNIFVFFYLKMSLFHLLIWRIYSLDILKILHSGLCGF